MPYKYGYSKIHEFTLIISNSNPTLRVYSSFFLFHIYDFILLGWETWLALSLIYLLIWSILQFITKVTPQPLPLGSDPSPQAAPQHGCPLHLTWDLPLPLLMVCHLSAWIFSSLCPGLATTYHVEVFVGLLRIWCHTGPSPHGLTLLTWLYAWKSLKISDTWVWNTIFLLLLKTQAEVFQYKRSLDRHTWKNTSSQIVAVICIELILTMTYWLIAKIQEKATLEMSTVKKHVCSLFPLKAR